MKKSSTFYTFLIGLLLVCTLLYSTVTTYIAAQNSGEFGEALGGAIIFAIMLIVDISSIGLIFITSMIGIIVHAVTKERKLGVSIAFAVIYYLSVVAMGFFFFMVGLDGIIGLPLFIVGIILSVLVILFTSLNLKHAVNESRGF